MVVTEKERLAAARKSQSKLGYSEPMQGKKIKPRQRGHKHYR